MTFIHMDVDQAVVIVQKLADGADPTTGERLLRSREVGAPRSHASAGTRRHVSCGAAGAPLCRSRCAVRVWARRGGGRLRFPPPWFSPRRPPFGGAPFPSADHRPGGKPILVHSLHSFTGGNRTAAIFVCLGRRPSGPPAEISPPLTEHSRLPARMRENRPQKGIGPGAGNVVRFASRDQLWPGGSR